MNGFFKKILYINLTTQKTFIEKIDDKILLKTLGGKGLATYLLLKNQTYKYDPFSDNNIIIFTLGPISNSSIFGSARYGVFTKSPLTGIFSESYSGGNPAVYMSKTGYDAFVITGKAKNPVYLEISDNKITFHKATMLWGKGTYDTENFLKNKYDKNIGIISIGPAGENLVNFAVIENNYWRSAGRTGVGAILGSKNLKAIVFKGSKKRPFFDINGIKEFSKKIYQQNKNNPGVQAYKEFGTPMLVAINNSINAFPTKYWHAGTLNNWENISAETMKKILNTKPKACPQCFIACGKLSKINEGPHKGLTIEGPEYETIFAFGGLCMINDLKEIAYINNICDNLGIDTISAGNLIAFTMEASKLGKIDYKINYGDVEKVVELLNLIVYRKGIGNILANGIKFAAKEWDMEDIAIHVKGLEPAGYDPRILKGMGLAYATSPRGACHLRATFYKAELSGIIDKNQIKGKAKVFIEFEERLLIHDLLILCRFYRDLYMWDELKKIIFLSTGINYSIDELRKLASNIIDLTRIFNIHCGITRKDDTLPQRFFNESINGNKLKKEDFELMLNDYYRLRRWDNEGKPLKNFSDYFN